MKSSVLLGRLYFS